MSTIIMDLCSYTRLGLTGYLLSRGVKKREMHGKYPFPEATATTEVLVSGEKKGNQRHRNR